MSPLTHSSQHPGFRDDLDNRVFEVVAKYEVLREPSRILQEILRKSEVYEAFCEVVTHHLAIITSRSQAFEDGKITIYDKALVQLCQSGAKVNNLGAHELYIEEFMGINPSGPIQSMDELVDKNIALKGLLVKVLQSSNESTTDHVTKNKLTAQDVVSDVTTSNGELGPENKRKCTRPQSGRVNADEYVRRLLDVYFEAKKDFYNLKDADYLDKAQAARFLRDTAENTLNCFRAHGLMSHRMVPELKRMFQHAKDKATEFLGGKKRRFEIEESQWVPAKRRHDSRRRYTSPDMRP